MHLQHVTTHKRLAAVVTVLLVFTACRGERHQPTTPLPPSRLVTFLPPTPPGWTPSEPRALTPEQAKMRPPASMAIREYRLGERMFTAVIVDPAWHTETYVMYMSERSPSGGRRIHAPFDKVDKWPATVHEYEEGDRELNVVVERYIVSLHSHSEDTDFLQGVFRSIDAAGLAKLE